MPMWAVSLLESTEQCYIKANTSNYYYDYDDDYSVVAEDGDLWWSGDAAGAASGRMAASHKPVLVREHSWEYSANLASS